MRRVLFSNSKYKGEKEKRKLSVRLVPLSYIHILQTMLLAYPASRRKYSADGSFFVWYVLQVPVQQVYSSSIVTAAMNKKLCIDVCSLSK